MMHFIIMTSLYFAIPWQSLFCHSIVHTDNPISHKQSVATDIQLMLTSSSHSQPPSPQNKKKKIKKIKKSLQKYTEETKVIGIITSAVKPQELWPSSQ